MNYAKEEDLTLVLLAQQNDQNAYTELITRYNNLCISEARKITFYLNDLDDVIQQCRIGLFKAIKTFSTEKGMLGAYFKLCVRNAALDTLKKADVHNRNRIIQNYDYNEALVKGADALGGITDSELGGIYCGSVIEIADKYFENKPTEKEIFNKYLEGFSYKDISNMLGIKVKDVDNKLQKIKKDLRKLLKDIND